MLGLGQQMRHHHQNVGIVDELDSAPRRMSWQS